MKQVQSFTGEQEVCNHSMEWNIQAGYSYYRCSYCRFIDGKKTFHQALAEERSKAWEGEAVKQSYIQGKSHGISEAYERVREEIGRKRKNILWEKHNRLDINADESKGYNQALDDLLSFLNNPDKQY